MDNSDNFLNAKNKARARKHLMNAVDTGLNFKLQQKVRKTTREPSPELLIENLPIEGRPIEEVHQEFKRKMLPFCYNFSSPNFMGFPDAGNSIAAIAGSIMSDMLQQNLINQSFCSPSGTFAEMSVLRWLREILGYPNTDNVTDIFDVGGVITAGGTLSNTIGILLARENHKPATMKNGVKIEDDYYLIVPKGIGHYSVKSAQMWTGCGNRLLEVDTINFRYDLRSLEKTLEKYKGKVMGLVAYAGDSRMMTVDHFDKIATLVKSIDPSIWLHADACHGFSLGFSEKLRPKLRGIERFDSITTDPHKVMNTPYTLSALLVRDTQKLRTTSSLSDLIMQEEFAFGQITPFIGSKSWLSLKLWFAMKNIGQKGFEEIIDKRHRLAMDFAELIKDSTDFILINEVDINSVAFMYTAGIKEISLDRLNKLNQKLHQAILKEGVYHLHQFSVPDPGIFKKDELIYPLRFMSGNPNLTRQHLVDVLRYLRATAQKLDNF